MIRIEQRGVVLHATLDAPATRNALTDAMVADLVAACIRADAGSDTRALVIRGSGGHFCAGGDFSGFQRAIASAVPTDGSDDPIAVGNRRFGALLERLRALEVASIAVVEGAAMGGGCGLAACCDFVIAARGALFATPEVTLGLPPAQIAPFIAERLGERAALRLMLTGRKIDAQQALACGLVDDVTDEVDTSLARTLDALVRAEPAALRATKSILRRRLGATLGQTLDHASRAFAAALRSGTASEGLAAFATKRSAAWVVPSAS